MNRCAKPLGLLLAGLLLVGCSSAPKKDAAEDGQTDTPTVPDKGDPQARFEEAVTQLKRNNLPGAETALRELEADFPEFSGPPTNLGLIYLRKQQYEQAVGAFSRASERNPENAVAQNGLGRAYRELGQYDRAEKAYERALTLNPNYAEAQFNLGILLDRYLQRPHLALAAYERYLTLTDDEELRVQAWIADLRERLTPAVEAAAEPVAEATVEQTP